MSWKYNMYGRIYYLISKLQSNMYGQIHSRILWFQNTKCMAALIPEFRSSKHTMYGPHLLSRIAGRIYSRNSGV